jgi:hypothetical protein
VFRWLNDDDSVEAETEQLRGDGKEVVSISSGELSADRKLIEHEADPDGPNKD